MIISDEATPLSGEIEILKNTALTADLTISERVPGRLTLIIETLSVIGERASGPLG
jgi:hypothetical protein